VLTRAEIEGSTIPEAVPVEGVVPETEVATGSATEPAEIAAPRVAEEVRGDALPEVSLEVVVRSAPMSEAPRLVGMDSSFWRMTLLARRR
jgi:hypothetical protein